MSLPVVLRAPSEGVGPVCANTVEYSPRGMRIRANIPFQEGQDYVVEVKDVGKPTDRYSVVWVRGPNESLYEAGLELRRESLV